MLKDNTYYVTRHELRFYPDEGSAFDYRNFEPVLVAGAEPQPTILPAGAPVIIRWQHSLESYTIRAEGPKGPVYATVAAEDFGPGGAPASTFAAGDRVYFELRSPSIGATFSGYGVIVDVYDTGARVLEDRSGITAPVPFGNMVPAKRRVGRRS